MIIDAHTHTFPEKIVDAAVSRMEAAARMRAHLRGTAAALEESMERAGVDLAINLPVATNPAQPHRLNLAAVAINEAEGRLISFGAAHPDDPNWREELDFIAAHGVKGVKLHPMYQGVDFDDIRYMRIVGRAAELGLAVTVHAGEDIGIPGPARCTPETALRVQRETGAEKLILAHMGGWNIWDRVRSELCGAPVYIDTSFSFAPINPHPDYPRESCSGGDRELLVDIIRAHGVGRVLFGSDSPWGDQRWEIENIRSLGFSREENAKILGENAVKILFE